MNTFRAGCTRSPFYVHLYLADAAHREDTTCVTSDILAVTALDLQRKANRWSNPWAITWANLTGKTGFLGDWRLSLDHPRHESSFSTCLEIMLDSHFDLQ
jgi:hypothetical protein